MKEGGRDEASTVSWLLNMLTLRPLVDYNYYSAGAWGREGADTGNQLSLALI